MNKTIKTIILTTVFSFTLSAQSLELNQRVRNLINLTKHNNSQISFYAEYSLEKEFGDKLAELLEIYEQEKIAKSVKQLSSKSIALTQMAKDQLAQQGQRAFPQIQEMISKQGSLSSGLQILQKMGNKAHSFQETISQIVATHENVSIRKQALEALAAIVTANQLSNGTIEMIQKSLSDEQIEQQKAIVKYVGNLEDAGKVFVPQIVEILETTNNWRLQEEAIKALGKIGAGAVAAIPTLEKLNRFEHKYFSLEDVYINQAITNSLAAIRS